MFGLSKGFITLDNIIMFHSITSWLFDNSCSEELQIVISLLARLSAASKSTGQEALEAWNLRRSTQLSAGNKNTKLNETL